MPYVNIRITREGVTTAQKEDLVRGVTELLAKILGKDPLATTVVIDEVETDNWGLGGELTTTIRKQNKALTWERRETPSHSR